jgi:Transposase DDE domain
MSGNCCKKGHFPEDFHIALVKQGQTLIPPGAQVVLLGDGEFDGTMLQRTIQEYGWSYVVRTGSHITVMWDGDSFRCETVASCITPGTLVALRDACVTEAAYGPIMLLCCWAKGYKDPLYLLTNMASADEAWRVYAQRFRIETFFSDQKSRGFHLHRSHLADPTRLARLLMAACFAYLWIIQLGTLCEQEGWISMIHRSDRCDLSLFQLGLRLLDYLLNEDCTIPVAFYVSI